MSEDHSHRSQYQSDRKSHKKFGKSKPSVKATAKGRLVDSSWTKKPIRGFQHSSQWRDVGSAQRHATALERRKKQRDDIIRTKKKYFDQIRGGVPKVVVLIPLSKHCNLKLVRKDLIRHSIHSLHSDLPIGERNKLIKEKVKDVSNPLLLSTVVSGVKKTATARRANYLVFECGKDKWSVLDALKMADIVTLVGCPARSCQKLFEEVTERTARGLSHREKEALRLGTGSPHTGENYPFVDTICDLIRSQGVASKNVICLYQYPDADSSLRSQQEIAAKKGFGKFASGLAEMRLVKGKGHDEDELGPMLSVERKLTGSKRKKAKRELKKAMAKVQSKVDTSVQRLFKCFVEREFGTAVEKKFRVLDSRDAKQIFRFFGSKDHVEKDWTKNRAHLMADSTTVEFETESPDAKVGRLKVTGFLRGERSLNLERPVHITGIGDFYVSRVEAIACESPRRKLEVPSEARRRRKALRRAESTSRAAAAQRSADGCMEEGTKSAALATGQSVVSRMSDATLMVDSSMADVCTDDSSDEDMFDTELMQCVTEQSPKPVSSGDSFVLAMADPSTQPRIERVKGVDPLQTTLDQSLITDEELRRASQRETIAVLPEVGGNKDAMDATTEVTADDFEMSEQMQFDFGGAKSKESAATGGRQPRAGRPLADEMPGYPRSRRRFSARDTTDHRIAWDRVLGWKHGVDDSSDDSEESVRRAALGAALGQVKGGGQRLDGDALMAQKRELEAEERQWPDEVRTPHREYAKDKFAQYRGVRNLRRANWDKFEMLPPEYARIHTISDWKLALKNWRGDWPKLTSNVVETGGCVRLWIEAVPREAGAELLRRASQRRVCYHPILVWNLLRFEERVSVCHYVLQKNAKHYVTRTAEHCGESSFVGSDPVQGLDNFIFDVGFRRFQSRPVFSEDSKAVDNHVVVKFLPDEGTSVASIYAPISFPPLPVLVFEDPSAPGTVARHKRQQSDGFFEETKHESDDELYDVASTRVSALVAKDLAEARSGRLRLYLPHFGRMRQRSDLLATGRLLNASAHRILIKQKILSGDLVRVQRSRAVVRNMFTNAKDVAYFQPLNVYTSSGQNGKIEEALGEKGLFKCQFDSHVKQSDAVHLKLFKRVFPVPDPFIFDSIYP